MAPRGFSESIDSSNTMNRRVNALIDLLSAAAMDTVDNGFLERELQRCSLELRNPIEGREGTQVLDSEVEKMIRQLHMSIRGDQDQQGNTAALRREPSLQDIETEINNLPQEHSGSVPTPSGSAPTPSGSAPTPGQTEEDKVDRRDYLEREESSTSYPRIGPGYSDSISVVSELTIPTVVAGVTVPDEEHYDNGPPLQIDFSSTPSKPKKSKTPPPPQQQPTTTHAGIHRPPVETLPKKNRPTLANKPSLRPPSRRVVTRPGGAAASRRHNHNKILAHIEASSSLSAGNGTGTSTGGPTKLPIKPPQQPVGMTVKDFPSLKDKSFFGGDETKKKSAIPSPRRDRQRSLLGKSNVYSASVTSQRMLLARQASTRRSTSYTKTSRNRAEKKDPVLIDDHGFIIDSGISFESTPTNDPFAVTSEFTEFESSNKFPDTKPLIGTSTPSTVANNGFGLRASSKDTKPSRARNRRSSTGTTRDARRAFKG